MDLHCEGRKGLLLLGVNNFDFLLKCYIIFVHDLITSHALPRVSQQLPQTVRSTSLSRGLSPYCPRSTSLQKTPQLSRTQLHVSARRLVALHIPIHKQLCQPMLHLHLSTIPVKVPPRLVQRQLSDSAGLPLESNCKHAYVEIYAVRSISQLYGTFLATGPGEIVCIFWQTLSGYARWPKTRIRSRESNRTPDGSTALDCQDLSPQYSRRPYRQPTMMTVC